MKCIKEIIILILIILNVFTFWLYKKEKKLRVDLQNRPTIEKVEISKNKIQTTIKNKDGSQRVIDNYVPPEGKVTVSLEEKTKAEDYTLSDTDKSALEKLNAIFSNKNKTVETIKTIVIDGVATSSHSITSLNVEIKDKGWCFNPGLSAFYKFKTLAIEPALDIKFGYYKKYSANIVLNEDTCGVSISRHVDDFIPSFTNVEIETGYDINQSSIFIGLRFNF